MSIEIVKAKTAEGLRDRLFDALDAVIEKKLGKDEVESICYVSEQILKTARHELEEFQEFSKVEHQKKEDEILKIREQREATKMIGGIFDKNNEL